MSLKKLNKLFRIRISRQRGVSLIELMIAVAILSAVSFGIFQSFQVGFWGMSDARARTIAVNLAQEKLEWVKGKALDNGQFPDINNPIKLSGKDFNVIYVVEDIGDDDPANPPSPQPTQNVLKKITTTVSWQKRDGTETKVEIEGLQSKTELFYQDKPTSILLNIDPKEITIGEKASITVTVLDQDNYPIPFKGFIELTMDPDTLGTLDLDDDGYLIFDGTTSYMQTNFNANTIGDAGSVVITARDANDELTPDSKEITITGGEATQISLEATPDSILINGEKSEITIKILDKNSFLAENWTGEIKLEIISDDHVGYLGNNPSSGKEITVEFNEENIKTIWFTSADKDVVAEIEATDKKGKLKSDKVSIDVTSGPPFKIGIEADPNNVVVNGASTITITILNESDIPVAGFNGQISLSIIKGSDIGSLDKNEFEFHSTDVSDGTIFRAGNKPGVVEIKAEYKSGNYSLQAGTETITVATGPPASIEINAIPKMILNDGSETSYITITLRDSGGNQSSFDDDKDLIFTINPEKGTISPSTIKLPAGYSSNTDIPVTYSCNDPDFEGEVTITVECVDCDELIPGQDEVIVQAAPSVEIKPADKPNIRLVRGFLGLTEKILFEIEIVGGTIDITQIDLAWIGSNLSQRRLRGITIYEKGDNGKERIKESWFLLGPYVKGYEDLLIIKPSGTWKSLEEGKEYTVELEFSQNVSNRTLFIQFHGSYKINGIEYEQIYGMEFEIPN